MIKFVIIAFSTLTVIEVGAQNSNASIAYNFIESDINRITINSGNIFRHGILTRIGKAKIDSLIKIINNDTLMNYMYLEICGLFKAKKSLIIQKKRIEEYLKNSIIKKIMYYVLITFLNGNGSGPPSFPRYFEYPNQANGLIKERKLNYLTCYFSKI